MISKRDHTLNTYFSHLNDVHVHTRTHTHICTYTIHICMGMQNICSSGSRIISLNAANVLSKKYFCVYVSIADSSS